MRRCTLALVTSACTGILLLASLARATCFDYNQILPDVGKVTLAARPASIVAAGSHVFVAASSAGLQVVDVTDPTTPTVVATLGGLGTLKDVTLDGTLLYGASDTGLHVIDVTVPATPTVLGSTPGALESLDFYGKTIAAGGGGGLRYYDVTDPATPVFVSSLLLSGSALDVLAHGDLFYAIAGTTLYAATTDPGMPSVLGQTFALFRGLAAEGTSLFNSNFVYNIANPSSPTFVGTYPTSQSPLQGVGSEVSGGVSFVPGMTLLQLTDVDPAVPGNSRPIGYVDFSTWPIESVEVSGGYAYVGTKNPIGTAWRLYVVDLGGPLEPTPKVVLDTPGNAGDVALQGNYAYVADGAAGLQIIDLTDPWAPAIVGSVVTTAAASEVAVSGNLACVRQGTELQVIDVSNPTSPILEGTYPGLNSGSDIAMTPGFAYVIRSNGFQVIDVSNPASPVAAGSAPTGGVQIEITGTTACLLSNQVHFVDISDPQVPVLVGSTGPIGSSPLGMAVDGTRVYVNEIHVKFLVFDIRNPSMPVTLPSLQYGNYRYTGLGMAASRSTVYVYSGSEGPGLWAIDVGNSTSNPKIVSGTVFETPVPASMRILNDVLVAAIGTAGLMVLPTQCLDATDIGPDETAVFRHLLLRPVWPNPSGGGTTLQYELPVAGTAALRIYDVAGRVVRELLAGHAAAGPHAVRWDGLDTAGRRAANGVYVAKLTSPAGVASRRVTVVR